MTKWDCPVECPVAARTSYGLGWSEAGLSALSAATFTPTRWAK
jgi:hypothetical protein